MRRFTAIARTAAIETMSQPLSAILFPVAVLAIHLLPAFQYHRFGAAGRLARETGLSALFVFGLFFAVPAVVRVIGRELAWKSESTASLRSQNADTSPRSGASGVQNAGWSR